MRKWFARKKKKGEEDEANEGEEDVRRDSLDPKNQQERGLGLISVRNSSSFNSSSGGWKDAEQEAKEKELNDKAEEVTLLSMKLEREIQRILYIAKAEGNNSEFLWMSKTVPLLALLVGHDKDEEYYAGLEKLLVLPSHTSEEFESEPVQKKTSGCDGGSPTNSTLEKNTADYNKDGDFTEDIGRTLPPPPPPPPIMADNDLNDKLGLCDRLILLSAQPDFTQRCIEANLPSNLLHCMRIMAVIEYEMAKPEEGYGKVNKEKETSLFSPLALQSFSKLTKSVTSRLLTLLVTLCNSGNNELVLEEIKPHFQRLLSIAVSWCPDNAIHVQIAASEVICALAAQMSSSFIWYIHSNKIIPDMVENLRSLFGDIKMADSKDHLSSSTKFKGRVGKGRAVKRSFSLRRLTASDMSGMTTKRRHSNSCSGAPTTVVNPEGGGSMIDNAQLKRHSLGSTLSRCNSADNSAPFLQQAFSPSFESNPPVDCLNGKVVEANGMWLTAIKAAVALVQPRSHHSKQLFLDFEHAGGYYVLLSLLKGSTGDRLSQMLEQIVTLSTSRDQETLVTNHSVFKLVAEVLLSSTPILSSVCGDEGLGNVVKLAASDTRLIVTRLAVGERHRREKMSNEEKRELLNGDNIRLNVVKAILNTYSMHPKNYVTLECRYHLLSSCIACLPSFDSIDLKIMVLKVLEVVCVMFRDVEPMEALECVATTFATCIGEILNLLTAWHDRYLNLESSTESTTEEAKNAPALGGKEQPGGDIDKILNATTALKVDAELLWELLEKILQFDVKKYEAFFVDAGLIESIALPFLSRSRILGASLSIGEECFSSDGGSSSNQLQLQSSILKAADFSLQTLMLLCNVLCNMISASPHLGRTARGQGLCKELHKIVEKSELQAAKAALKVLEQIALCDCSGLKDELDFMLKVVQKAEYEGQYRRQTIVLSCIRGLLAEGNCEVKDAWREVSGFEVVIGLLLSFDRALPIESLDSTSSSVLVGQPIATGEGGCGSNTLTSPFLDDVFDVIEASFAILITAMSAPSDVFDKRSGYQPNRLHMKDHIHYGLLASRLYNSGAPIHPRFAVRTANLVLQMITEKHLEYITELKPPKNDCEEERKVNENGSKVVTSAAVGCKIENSTVRNADAVNVLLDLLPIMPESLTIPVIDALLTFVHAGDAAELHELAVAGVIRSVAHLVMITQLPLLLPSTTVSVPVSVPVSAFIDEKEMGMSVPATTTVIPRPLNTLPNYIINGMMDSYSAAIWERSNSLGISPHLNSFDIMPRLLELVITLSAHFITGPNLKLVIQAIVLPLLIPKNGKKNNNLDLGKLLGWDGALGGPPMCSTILNENLLVSNSDGGEDNIESTTAAEKKKWGQLDILTAMVTGTSGIAGDGCAGSVPYLKLGGPSTLNLNSIGTTASSSSTKDIKVFLNETPHMYLMEKLFFSCAREEVQMVHVDDLKGSKYSSQGVSIAPIERPNRFPWPGQAGYGASFWVRMKFSLKHQTMEKAVSWKECSDNYFCMPDNSTHSMKGSISETPPLHRDNPSFNYVIDGGSTHRCDVVISEQAKSNRENSSRMTTGSDDLYGSGRDGQANPSSPDDARKCRSYQNGEEIVWIVSFSSANGKAWLCLYMDIVEHTLCVQTSAARNGTEFRSKPLTTFAMAKYDAWHHIAFSHVRRSMMGKKMQGTTDSLHLWVDGEEVALFNVDLPSFSSQGVPTTATFGIPVPQLFYEPCMKNATIPLWHLGPTIVTCEPLSTSAVSAIFVVGPSYSGVFAGEHPLFCCSAITITTLLRRLLYFGGSSGLGTGHDGVHKALCDRNLQDFEKLLTATDRNVLRERWDRCFMKNILFDTIAPDSIAIWLSAQNSKPVSPTASYLSSTAKSSQTFMFPAPSLITNWVQILHSSDVAAVYGGYGAKAVALPRPLSIALESIGGLVALYPLLFMAQTDHSIATTLRLFSAIIRGSQANAGMMHSNLGYVFIANVLREKQHCLGPSTVDACFTFATDCVTEEAEDVGQPSDWNKDLSILNRDKAAYVSRGHSMGFGVQGNELSRGKLILITEACAMKHLVMNHQVWGARSSTLLTMVLYRLNSLLSPSNSHSFCCSNALVLHRIGLIRWTLHILMEMREEVNSVKTTTMQDEKTAIPSSTGGGGSVAHVLPAAGVAACGLDTRDEFVMLCTLLLQRALIINGISRDFDRVVGATVALKADPSVIQFRQPGSEPTTLDQEKVMQCIGILPEEGSLGTIILTQEAVVRVSLLRMLFETLSISGGLVKEGDMVCGPQPCSAVVDLLGCMSKPVHCMYEGKQKSLIGMCARSLKPDWFLCLLEMVTEEAGLTVILQLLCFLMQQVPEFAKIFNAKNGVEVLEIVIRRCPSSLPVLLPVVALLMHLPISGIPLYASEDTMCPKALEDLFDSTPGPQTGDSNAVNCMFRVLLPSLGVNLSILYGGGIGGTTTTSSFQSEGGYSGGGDVSRAATVSAFLLNLFYRSWKRLNGFRLLLFEPGLMEAFSNCVKILWDKPGTIVEDVPCSTHAQRLVRTIISDTIQLGSQPGSGTFNAVTQILMCTRREQRVMNMRNSCKDAGSSDGFRYFVIECLMDYCRTTQVEQQQAVDVEIRRRSISMSDVPVILQNFIGAATAAATLLTTDGDCSLYVYLSVVEFCISIVGSSLWDCIHLQSIDHGEICISAASIVLRITTVLTLRRAMMNVIGYEGNFIRLNSESAHPMRRQELEEDPSSSSFTASTDIDLLLKLLQTIHFNLDILLPFDLPDNGNSKQEQLPHLKRCHSSKHSGSSSYNDGEQLGGNEYPRSRRRSLDASHRPSSTVTSFSNLMVADDDSSPSCATTTTTTTTSLPALMVWESGGTHKGGGGGLEGGGGGGTTGSSSSTAVVSSPLSLELPIGPFPNFISRLSRNKSLGEKLIGCGMLAELLSLLTATNNSSSIRNESTFSMKINPFCLVEIREETLDLIASIMCLQRGRLQLSLKDMNCSQAAELKEITGRHVYQTSSDPCLTENNYLECTTTISGSNERQQPQDGPQDGGGGGGEGSNSSTSSHDFMSEVGITSPSSSFKCATDDALKKWATRESKELSALFKNVSSLIVPHLESQLQSTISKSLPYISLAASFEDRLPGNTYAVESIKRAEVVSKTYHRVAVSHKRWLYAGLDGMVASMSQWQQWQGRFQGGFSLWEGGVFSLVVGEEDTYPFHFASSDYPYVGGQGTFAIAPLYSKKWKLDLHESCTPSRMRCRLIQNRIFFVDYDVLLHDDKLVGFKAAPVAIKHVSEGSVMGGGEMKTMGDGSGGEEESESLKKTDISDTIVLRNLLQKVESCSKPAEPISFYFDDDDGSSLEESYHSVDGDAESRIDGEEEGIEMEEETSVMVMGSTSSITEEQESGSSPPSTPSNGITLGFDKSMLASCVEKGYNQSRLTLEDVSEVMTEDSTSSTTSTMSDSVPVVPESKEETETSKETCGHPQMFVFHDISGFETEVFTGFLDPVDWPVEACFNAHRCIDLEVRPCVALICKQALYVVTGYSYKKEKDDDSIGSGRPPSYTAILSGLRRVPQRPSCTTGKIHRGNSAIRFKVALRRASSKWANGTQLLGLETRETSNGGAGHHHSLVSSDSQEEDVDDVQGDEEMYGEKLDFSDVDVYHCTWGKLHAVHRRRYELRETGIEVFDTEGSSILVILDSHNLQEEFLASLLEKPLKNSVFCAGKHRLWLPRGSTLAHARAAYKQSMKALRQEYTNKWLRGYMTNFDYLMALNTLAGRSINDITQYPVFPWVLADYTSENLDLTDEGSFRDFTKPMGAIGEERAAQFAERYEQFVAGISGEKEKHHHPPPFFYGTHYSCAGYVLHYLLRLEPFSHHALALQGGMFDKADRLFRDVKSSWDSASKENLQDVRELIPEFFYLPEFLVNSNQFDYGVTQIGTHVDHVELPPWAKGDPREFVRLNRQALESDHVSRNLHHWIDLIFGYKQRGEEAIKACNVFAHLTYEGEVDIDSISDPLLRESAIAQIKNFGQTPSRLFNQAHPKKEIPLVLRDDGVMDVAALAWHEPSTPPMCIVGAPDHIALVPVTKASGIGYYGLRDLPISDAIYSIESNRIIAVGKGSILYQPEPASDIYIRFDSPITPDGICFYSAFHASGKGSICDRLISCQSGLHQGAISAAVCTEGGVVVSGGEDASVRVWDLKVLAPYSKKKQVPSDTKSLLLRGVLSGHSSTITCLDACEPCGLLVSGSEDSNVLVWDLWNCSFIRHLPGHSTSIRGVSTNRSNGNIVTFAGMVVRVWTTNGDLLARYTFNDSNVSSPTCVCATSCPDWQDGVSVIVGHENGDVTVWGIQWSRSRIRKNNKATTSIVVPVAEDPSSKSITDMPISSNNCDMDLKGGLLASSLLSLPHELSLRLVLHSAHSSPITCVRTIGKRGLLVGDSKGMVSKWLNIRLSDIPIDEANGLIHS